MIKNNHKNTEAAESNKLASHEKENQKNAEKANAINIIKTLIKSISHASSLEELALLVRAARDYIQDYAIDNPQLMSQLDATAAKTETSISMQHKSLKNSKPITKKSDEELDKMMQNVPEILVNMASLAALVCLAKDSAFGEKVDNIYDGAFGETIKALEKQAEKEKQRESSIARVDVLKKIGDALKDSANISDEKQNELIAEAAKIKIKLRRDEKGKLVVNEKTMRAVAKVTQQDMAEIDAKREERKSRDNIDNIDVALQSGGLSSLFGDDEFEAEPSPHSTTKAEPSPTNLISISVDEVENEEKRAKLMVSKNIDHVELALKDGSLSSLFGDDEFEAEPVKFSKVSKAIAGKGKFVSKAEKAAQLSPSGEVVNTVQTHSKALENNVITPSFVEKVTSQSQTKTNDKGRSV